MADTRYRGAARGEPTTECMKAESKDPRTLSRKKDGGLFLSRLGLLTQLVGISAILVALPLGQSYPAQDIRVPVRMEMPTLQSERKDALQEAALTVPIPLPHTTPSQGSPDLLKLTAISPSSTNEKLFEFGIQPVPQQISSISIEAADSWKQYAINYEADPTKPWIAIVIDDVGVNKRGAEMAVRMPAPLTLAFMTYADNLASMTKEALGRGHELLLHFPMEPDDLKHNDPGRNALMVGLSDAELDRRLEWGLGRFDGFVGLNNHMGSRFTRNRAGMHRVVLALRKRGLLFLDSVTTGSSIAAAEARRAGLTVLERDIFLDHIPTSEEVARQLALLEQRAKAKGFAIGIGHPQEFTLDVIRAWLPLARSRGFDIVPISVVAKRLESVG